MTLKLGWFGGRMALSGQMSVGHVVAAINYLAFALFPPFPNPVRSSAFFQFSLPKQETVRLRII